MALAWAVRAAEFSDSSSQHTSQAFQERPGFTLQTLQSLSAEVKVWARVSQALLMPKCKPQWRQCHNLPLVMSPSTTL